MMKAANGQTTTAKVKVESSSTSQVQTAAEMNTAVISEEAIASLLFMIEEEKMARDIYDALYEQTGLQTFDSISDSEQTHYDTLLSTAYTLGLNTDSLSTQAGLFTNNAVQSLYDQLMLQASVSTEAAINVGITIEVTDIADLKTVIETTEVALLGQVYTHLLDASINHLAAFESIA